MKELIFYVANSSDIENNTPDEIMCEGNRYTLKEFVEAFNNQKINSHTDQLYVREEDKLIYDLLSPDRIPIENNGGYKSMGDLRKAYLKWKSRFEQQGYYSSNDGHIPLNELFTHCNIITL